MNETSEQREPSDIEVSAAAHALHNLIEPGTPWSATTVKQRDQRIAEAYAALRAAGGVR